MSGDYTSDVAPSSVGSNENAGGSAGGDVMDGIG